MFWYLIINFKILDSSLRKAMETTANQHDPGSTLPSHTPAALLHHHVPNLGLERKDLSKMPELQQPPESQFAGKGFARKPVHGADKYKAGRPRNFGQEWQDLSGVWSWPETGSHEIMTKVICIFATLAFPSCSKQMYFLGYV